MQNSIVIEDERGYLKPRGTRRLSEIDIHEVQIIPHNTMRFDVHMAWIDALLEDQGITKQQLAKVISDAIVAAIDRKLGTPFVPPSINIHNESIMMHRQMISYDFS